MPSQKTAKSLTVLLNPLRVCSHLYRQLAEASLCLIPGQYLMWGSPSRKYRTHFHWIQSSLEPLLLKMVVAPMPFTYTRGRMPRLGMACMRAGNCGEGI